jgi:hypothetical protein
MTHRHGYAERSLQLAIKRSYTMRISRCIDPLDPRKRRRGEFSFLVLRRTELNEAHRDVKSSRACSNTVVV